MPRRKNTEIFILKYYFNILIYNKKKLKYNETFKNIQRSN